MASGTRSSGPSRSVPSSLPAIHSRADGVCDWTSCRVRHSSRTRPAITCVRSPEHGVAKSGFMPHVPVEITEFSTIRELVGRGMGLALLPHDEHTSRRVREIPLTPNTYRRDIALAWSPTAVTPVSRRLLDFLRAEWPSIRERPLRPHEFPKFAQQLASRRLMRAVPGTPRRRMFVVGTAGCRS